MTHAEFVELTVEDAQNIAAIAEGKDNLLDYAKALRKFTNDLIDRVRAVDGGDPNCPQVPPPPPPQ
jgi:hypothetical protein